MAAPGDKAGASLPATLGEGCLARFDPSALSPEDGTEFPGAAELWAVLNPPGDDVATADAPAGRRTPARRRTDKSSR
ncbi:MULTISPECIES: hypothetical protein [unclassified Pseudomonas]|uniref:hypothetical protein n=1 Tax=unclassified Pseudomonas TaxID=196821 RepID=UPI002096DCA3|nr:MULTISPECIES: hypothetical protein [unclassified Pseudomonas]MCO7520764.1 hypothetical protein [Pseudomonas sp. 1]MCO7541049.1 hypothetical protein [Pseudomonas sp. VA159-2]